MNLSKFWRLLEEVDKETLNEGYCDESVQSLITSLSLLSKHEIKDFETHLIDVLYELDGRIYMDNAGDSSDSPDGFLYARCYVVAMGREYYNEVLNNPEKMPKSSDKWCESLLFVAEHAWLEKTDSEWEYFPDKSYETGSNIDNW